MILENSSWIIESRIDVTYATNKSILLEKFIKAMKNSFIRSEEYLDIETTKDETVENRCRNIKVQELNK